MPRPARKFRRLGRCQRMLQSGAIHLPHSPRHLAGIRINHIEQFVTRRLARDVAGQFQSFIRFSHESIPLHTKSNTSKLRGSSAALASYSTFSGPEKINGTIVSKRPPCERNGRSSFERS